MELSEYSDEALQNELQRRQKQRDQGLCDYCGHPFTEPTCRFEARHLKPGEFFYREWKIKYSASWVQARNRDDSMSISVGRYGGRRFGIYKRSEDGYMDLLLGGQVCDTMSPARWQHVTDQSAMWSVIDTAELLRGG